MNVKERIERELKRLPAKLADGGVHRLHLDTENGRLVCLVTAVDGLACSLDSIVVSSERTAATSIGEMKRRGEHLVARLSYLMEPLDVIEVDEHLQVVQLRSSPPHREEGAIRYYELELRPGEYSLRRYRKQPQCSREAIPITVTREVFRRLVTDFASVA